MEDNRVSDEELLVVSSDEVYEKVFRYIWLVLEDKELYKSTSRTTNDK